jgi:AraC-like DNA-binding protein
MQLVDIHTDSIILNHTIDNQKTDRYALHCHNFYEVFYFIAGDVSYLVDGKRYAPKPNSILLIAPHVFHGVKIESDSAYERISLHFMPGFLPLENQSILLSPFQTTHGTANVYFTDDRQKDLHHFFKQLMDCRNMDEDYRELSLRIRLEALLSQILFMSQSLKGQSEGASSTTAVSSVIKYLNDHIGEPVTLDDISSKFYISKHHLNKIFRKATGTTVLNYVIHKRVVMAQNLMLQGQSANSAAAIAGFGDYSSFYRAYIKIFRHAPSVKQIPILLH